MTTAAVVLAAGFSRRLGRPKQEVLLGGETLLERAVRTATDAGLAPVIAVVREAAWTERLAALGAVIVPNAEAAEGMASSVRAGVARAQTAAVTAAVLMTCDQPLLRPGHLRQLCAEPTRVVASGYGGRKGVPAFFPASAFAELLALRGDAGARDLLRDAEVIPNEELVLDIDTEEDLREAKRRMAPGSA